MRWEGGQKRNEEEEDEDKLLTSFLCVERRKSLVCGRKAGTCVDISSDAWTEDIRKGGKVYYFTVPCTTNVSYAYVQSYIRATHKRLQYM